MKTCDSEVSTSHSEHETDSSRPSVDDDVLSGHWALARMLLIGEFISTGRVTQAREVLTDSIEALDEELSKFNSTHVEH